jgi:plastocyanin
VRAWALIAVGTLGTLAAVVPALGADQTVTTAAGNTFSPASVTINTGEQVTITNGAGSGTHDVQFDDRPAPEVAPGSAWSVMRRFDQAGTYGFRCNLHTGMTGTVVVNAAPAPPPGTTTPPGTTNPPGTTPVSPGAPGAPPPSGPAAAKPPALAARVLTARACTRKSATCKRPGVRLAVTTQEALVVTGELRRRAARGGYRPSGRVRFNAPKGRSTATLQRRNDRTRIGPGDYRLTLSGVRAAPASDGIRSARVVVRFSVRR